MTNREMARKLVRTVLEGANASNAQLGNMLAAVGLCGNDYALFSEERKRLGIGLAQKAEARRAAEARRLMDQRKSIDNKLLRLLYGT